MASDSSHQVKLASFVVGVAGIALYLNTLGLGFCFDDETAIVQNKDLRPSTSWLELFKNDFWGAPMSYQASHKSYRPLTVATFRVNYALHGLDSSGYHLVNAVVHGFASGLFVVFCNVAFRESTSSFLAGLLFAAHPIHTEAVAGLVGRAEGLCASFFMLAFLAYVKAAKKHSTDWKWLSLCILSTIVAVLCKELGLTVIGVCLVYDLFAIQRSSLPVIVKWLSTGSMPRWVRSFSTRLAVMLATLVAIMMARLYIMKNVPIFLPFDNPAAFQSSPVRQLTQLHLIFINMYLLFCPAGLLADWSMGTVPLVTSILDGRNILTILTFAFLAALAITAVLGTRRRNRILVLATSTLVIPFIPASNLLFSVGFVVAERILYIPSMGFCLLVALALENLILKRFPKRLAYISSLLLVSLFCGKTFIRNYQWESDFTIFSAALKVTETNAKVYSNIGHHYENRGDFETADRYFSRSVVVQPNDIGAWMNVARVSKAQKNRRRGIEAYRTAISYMPKLSSGANIRVAPKHLQCYLKLAELLREDTKDFKESEEMYRAALSVNPSNVDAYNGYSQLLREQGRMEESGRRLQQALAIDANNIISVFNLGVLGLKREDLKVAEHHFKKVLTLDADHVSAIHNLGLLCHNTKRLPEAINYMQRLLSIDGKHVGATFSLGVLHLDSAQPEQALSYFNKTLQLEPEHEDALFNLALTLSDMRRYEQALVAVHNLLKVVPRHFKGRLLSGDVNTHSGNPAIALKWYDAALEMKASSTIAMHNKAVVLASLNRNEDALLWMKKTLELEPNYPDGRKHLAALEGKVAAMSKQKRSKSP